MGAVEMMASYAAIRDGNSKDRHAMSGAMVEKAQTRHARHYFGLLWPRMEGAPASKESTISVGIKVALTSIKQKIGARGILY